MPVPAKKDRLAEFLRRLDSAARTTSFDEAYEQLCVLLNAVEDEMTGIPHNPDRWQTDGRMYPPQLDNLRAVPGLPLVSRLRSLRHNTFIGANGSVEIRELPGDTILLSKPGRDGRGVWEL